MDADRPDENGPWSDDALDGLLKAAVTHGKRSRPKRRKAVWGTAVAAALTLTVLVIALRPRAQPLDYELGAVLGGISEERRVTRATSVRAVADSALSIRLRPRASRAAPACVVFTRCGTSTRRVHAKVEAKPGGGLSVSGRAEAWFGAAPARCEVWLGLGDIEDVREPPRTPMADASVQWLAVEVAYLGPLKSNDE